jgi:hypothetical protein
VGEVNALSETTEDRSGRPGAARSPRGRDGRRGLPDLGFTFDAPLSFQGDLRNGMHSQIVGIMASPVGPTFAPKAAMLARATG